MESTRLLALQKILSLIFVSKSINLAQRSLKWIVCFNPKVCYNAHYSHILELLPSNYEIKRF